MSDKYLRYLYISLFLIAVITLGVLSNDKSSDILLGDVSSIPGDANGDEKISSLDYIAVKRHILNISKLTGDNLTRADINGDGKINSIDYITIRKVILGLTPKPTAYPKETTKPTVAPVITAKPTTVPSKTPVSSTNKYTPQFEITHWWGVLADYIDDTQAGYMKDAGFTLVLAHSFGSDKNKYKQKIQSAIEVFNKYGLKVIVSPYEYIVSSDYSKEKALKLAQEAINDYSKYPNVIEYFLTDEPDNTNISSQIGSVVDLIHKKDPDADGYYNLLPKGAHPGGNYKKDYLAQFAKNAHNNTLSFDRYVFTSDEVVNKVDYYDNLRDVRDVSAEYNKIGTSIILLTEHINGSVHYKNVSRNDIAFQVSVSLAFGMRRISYYTYSIDLLREGHPEADYKNAIVDSKHEPTKHYNDVKSVNKWTLKLGQELFNKKNVGVYGLNEPTLPNYETLNGSISATKAGLVSIFDDKSFMLVNTEIQKPNDNTFTLDSMSGLSYYDTNKDEWFSINKNIEIDNFKIVYKNKQIIIKPGYCILLKGGNYTKISEHWENIDNKWFYFDANGKKKTNTWLEYQNKWYYLNASGEAVTNWQELSWSGGTNWFYFDSDGAMLTGWQKLKWDGGKKENWFYFGSNGAMGTGWQQIDSKWYYFDTNNGSMTENTCITINKEKFCFDKSGVCISGNGC